MMDDTIKNAKSFKIFPAEILDFKTLKKHYEIKAKFGRAKVVRIYGCQNFKTIFDTFEEARAECNELLPIMENQLNIPGKIEQCF